jgi:methyltransferase (TIGR00027 family)
LRVFEADFPATQAWKREMLAAAGVEVPANLRFVPLDLEHKTLMESLGEAGLDAAEPSFFSWLGVTPYLTLVGFRSTLWAIAQLPDGTGVTFDFAIPPEMLSPERRAVFDVLAGRVASAGEPFQLFFAPGEVEEEMRRAGFRRTEQADHNTLNELYFRDRQDGLKLSPVGIGMMATGWV